MRVTLRLFAILRDRFGGESQRDLTLPDGATAADAEAVLIETRPELRELLARSAFAINREYAARTARLNDGDELAIIPPVSGG